MSTEKSLAKLVELSNAIYNPNIQNWKDKGGKVVGFFCSYIPEEFIYAAGMVPYRIRPVGCTDTPSASAYMSGGVHCTFARGCLEYFIEGKFDFLDGMVSMNSCDHMRRLPDLIEKAGKKFPFTFFLHVPYSVKEDSIEWYKSEMKKLKEALEKFTGKKITDDKLRDAINLCNKTRRLVSKLYELRKQKNPPITGSEALSITTASNLIPKEEYNQLLEEALQEFSKRKGISDYKARLMIAGSALDNPAFVKTIEDLGGLVCTDDLCWGGRALWDEVETKGDLMENFAQRYMHRPCCGRMVDQCDNKEAFWEKMISDYKIDGFIHQRMRYCDIYGGDLLHAQTKMKKMDIPFLSLEKEYWLSGVGQLRTRVQAFLETIEARR